MGDNVYVVFFTDPNSYNSIRQFKGVALTDEDAHDLIKEITKSSSYAQGERYDVDFWLSYGFKIEPHPLHGLA